MGKLQFFSENRQHVLSLLLVRMHSDVIHTNSAPRMSKSIPFGGSRTKITIQTVMKKIRIATIQSHNRTDLADYFQEMLKVIDGQFHSPKYSNTFGINFYLFILVFFNDIPTPNGIAHISF